MKQLSNTKSTPKCCSFQKSNQALAWRYIILYYIILYYIILYYIILYYIILYYIILYYIILYHIILYYTMYKKLLEKTKTLLYFDSNLNRDGMEEERVAKTVVRIKCQHK